MALDNPAWWAVFHQYSSTVRQDDEGHSDTRCITRKDFERFLRDAELTVVTDVFERCAGEDKLMDPFQVLLRS